MSNKLYDFLTVLFPSNHRADLSTCKKAFQTYLHESGIEFFNYGGFSVSGPNTSKAYFADTNFKSEWVEEYFANKYSPHDYVLNRAKWLNASKTNDSFKLGEWLIPHLSNHESGTIAVLRGAADAGMQDGMGLVGIATSKFNQDKKIHWGLGLGGEQKTGRHIETQLTEISIATSIIIDKLQSEFEARIDGYNTPLSPREKDVLSCFADGLQRDRTAEFLGISTNTVDLHSRNLRKKLGAATLPEAVAKAYRYGLFC